MKRRRTTTSLLWVVPTAAGLFAVALLAANLLGIPATELTRDVTTLYEDAPPWLGILATAGVLAWTSGAAIALFSAWAAPRPSANTRYLLAMGATSLVLALDDQFRVTQIIHNLASTPEGLIEAAYGVAALSILWHYRLVVQTTNTLLLASAGLLLAFAAAMDLLGTRESIEDLLKFTGAVALAAYLADAGYRAVTNGRPSSTPA